MRSAIDQCAIRKVLTTRAFAAKLELAELPGQLFLEDLTAQIGLAARLRSAAALLLPARLISRLLFARTHIGPLSVRLNPVAGLPTTQQTRSDAAVRARGRRIAITGSLRDAGCGYSFWHQRRSSMTRSVVA